MAEQDSATWADWVIREGLRGSSAGLDLDGTGRALDKAIVALQKMADALAELNYRVHEERVVCPACRKKVVIEVPGADLKNLGRAFPATASMIDDIARLQEFARGLPDRRVDHGAEVLKWLTVEELERVRGRMVKGEKP